MPPALILTLHRSNATPDKLPVLGQWLHSLEQIGVNTVRLHILEVDDPQVRAKCSLTAEENIAAFLFFARAEAGFRTLRFDVFDEMRRLLLGDDGGTTCIWRACDPYTDRKSTRLNSSHLG